MDTINLILLGLVFVLFVWTITNTILQLKTAKKIKEIFHSERGDLYDLIKTQLKQVKQVENYAESLEQEFKKLLALSKKNIQKVGFLRYNAFGKNDTGGNQSFSVAFLDYENTGVIVTSIHSREGTRVYSKQVKNGKSAYNLSEEEQLVLNKYIK